MTKSASRASEWSGFWDRMACPGQRGAAPAASARLLLRFTDLDGLRLTCFATNTKGGQLADLELRHRRRARCEDRIRNARDTGLRNLPRTGPGWSSSRSPSTSSPGCQCAP